VASRGLIKGESWHTGGEALLELLGLIGVLQDKGVEVSLAPDLELDLLGVLVLLDPGSCGKAISLDSMFRAVVSNNFSSFAKRTRGILPPADLDELFAKPVSIKFGRTSKGRIIESYLLDIGDFLRHFGGCDERPGAVLESIENSKVRLDFESK